MEKNGHLIERKKRESVEENTAGVTIALVVETLG